MLTFFKLWDIYILACHTCRHASFVYCLDASEQADVTAAYDSDSADELGPDSGKRTKSSRVRQRRGSRLNSVTSYCSVDHRSCRMDPSLRCVSVSSASQGSVDVDFEHTTAQCDSQRARVQCDSQRARAQCDSQRARAQCDSQRASCLLYTSPSPRDGLLSRMPSSA